MSLSDVLHRHVSRLLGAVPEATEVPDTGVGARASVPGRREAAEAALNPFHVATLSTPAVLGSSLLAAAVLGWYYVHGYVRTHASAQGSGVHVTEIADSPLPPLEHLKATEPKRVQPDAHVYTIGDVLKPDDTAADDGAGPTTREEGDAMMAHADAPATPGLAPQPPQARRLDGSVFTRTKGPAEATSPIDDTIRRSGASSDNANIERSSLDRLLRAEATPTAAATMLSTQRLLLPRGAFLDCTLETAIDSTLAGLTTCITAFDTFSADGTVVLLERGTKLVGEMRSQVQQGTARVFVLWTEARTPKGILVALASPSTDALGRSGIGGTVDRHFADRFGAAILVSVINGAIQSMVNRSQQSGGTVILNPSGAGDVATEVLRNTLSIPPTVRIPPGERIQVLVARDLDFRNVYSLHAR